MPYQIGIDFAEKPDRAVLCMGGIEIISSPYCPQNHQCSGPFPSFETCAYPEKVAEEPGELAGASRHVCTAQRPHVGTSNKLLPHPELYLGSQALCYNSGVTDARTPHLR